MKVEKPGVEVALLSMAMLAVGVTGCDVVKGVALKEKHAAVAYDEETGGWGYSYNQLTAKAAEKEATKKCKTCTVHLTWNKGCGALAQSKEDKKVLVAETGISRGIAEMAAKKACKEKGKGDCKVVVWACNSK